jgi:hypothetical protein
MWQIILTFLSHYPGYIHVVVACDRIPMVGNWYLWIKCTATAHTYTHSHTCTRPLSVGRFYKFQSGLGFTLFLKPVGTFVLSISFGHAGFLYPSGLYTSSCFDILLYFILYVFWQFSVLLKRFIFSDVCFIVLASFLVIPSAGHRNLFICAVSSL